MANRGPPPLPVAEAEAEAVCSSILTGADLKAGRLSLFLVVKASDPTTASRTTRRVLMAFIALESIINSKGSGSSRLAANRFFHVSSTNRSFLQQIDYSLISQLAAANDNNNHSSNNNNNNALVRFASCRLLVVLVQKSTRVMGDGSRSGRNFNKIDPKRVQVLK
jgi:hypothetical protein